MSCGLERTFKSFRYLDSVDFLKKLH